MSALADELAPRIAPVVLANITTRYPYHDAHLTTEDAIPGDPTLAHPAFGNSFDWHSSVHSHWTALQVLGCFDDPALRVAVATNLSETNLAAETAYLQTHRLYERPYGWAWAMRLATAAPPVRDIANLIAELAASWLHVLREPVRHGVHSNTAFALGLMFDAAKTLNHSDLERTIAARAAGWFGTDRDWPEQWERSGTDFLSPGLAQADLMRRLVTPSAFARWWRAFLPTLSPQARILTPVTVTEAADGQIVHWHGLNLSRAGMLARIAVALHEPLLLESALSLYRASVERAIFGSYVETHWLATFAWDAAIGIDRARAVL
jgi:hypothetical protein